MANYYASARSNYFHVKDPSALRDQLHAFRGIEIVEDSEGRLALLADEEGWPSWSEDPNTGEDQDFDIAEFVAPHLQDDEVAVFVEVGAEKLRFLSGYAHAINNRGETRILQLGDIYGMAKELGPNVTQAEY